MARPYCAISKNAGCARSTDSTETGSQAIKMWFSTCALLGSVANGGPGASSPFLCIAKWKKIFVGFSPLKFLALAVIRFYRLVISPLLPRSCRYYPTCSSYAEQAFQKYGFFKAFGKSLWRLLRCNPFSHGGVDHP